MNIDDLDFSSLNQFSHSFPSNFLREPSGKLPERTIVVDNLKDAVLVWEAKGFDITEFFPEASSNIDLPNLDKNQLIHGYDFWGMTMSNAADRLKELYSLRRLSASRKLIQLISNYTSKMSTILHSQDFNFLREATTVFDRVAKYLLLPEEERKNFLHFESAIKIMLAGGHPVGWYGDTVDGCFIVFQPKIYQENIDT